MASEKVDTSPSLGAAIDSLGTAALDKVEEFAQALREARAERDVFQRKYHEALDILSAWDKIDLATAVGQLQESRKREAAADALAARYREALRKARSLVPNDDFAERQSETETSLALLYGTIDKALTALPVPRQAELDQRIEEARERIEVLLGALTLRDERYCTEGTTKDEYWHKGRR